MLYVIRTYCVIGFRMLRRFSICGVNIFPIILSFTNKGVNYLLYLEFPVLGGYRLAKNQLSDEIKQTYFGVSEFGQRIMSKAKLDLTLGIVQMTVIFHRLVVMNMK